MLARAVLHAVIAGTLSVGSIGCAASTRKSSPARGAATAYQARSKGTTVPEQGHVERRSNEVPPAWQTPSAAITEIPRWYRVMDPLNTFRFHPQPAVPGYRPLPQRSRSPFFPNADFSEIWGYEIGASYPLNCNLLARDGSLCPNVVYPGRRLDEAQSKQLVSIARHPTNEIGKITWPDGSQHPAVRPLSRCGDEPVAMFVFYDQHHSPVGVVGVDEDCGQWSFLPAPKDAWVGFATTQDNEQRILRQLCLGLDLLTCAPKTSSGSSSEPRPNTDARMAIQRALLPLLLREWPGVDESKSVADASQYEREQLCAWYSRSATITASLFNRIGSWLFSGLSLDDEQGHSLRLQSHEECVENFPVCRGTVGAARACITRQLEHFWDRNDTCHLDCVWGIKALGIPDAP
jgi:hypothetical protein